MNAYLERVLAETKAKNANEPLFPLDAAGSACYNIRTRRYVGIGRQSGLKILWAF